MPKMMIIFFDLLFAFVGQPQFGHDSTFAGICSPHSLHFIIFIFNIYILRLGERTKGEKYN